MRVLLVEDNDELVSLLVKGLARSGFSADAVANAGDAAHSLAAMRYAAIVLDLGLPDQDGLTLLRSVSDRVNGLRAGADDYLVKPFAMEELVARLQALLRRPGNLLGRQLSFGNVSLETEGRQVFVDGTLRVFAARETAILEILLRRGGNVVPKRLFEDQLFGLSGDVGSNAVEVYVHRLRKMLSDCGATVKIHTVRGVGYLLSEEKAAV
jgi:two-component system response regulator TctD